jgi:hypothetical protein
MTSETIEAPVKKRGRGRPPGTRTASVYPAPGVKVCTICKKAKPVAEFYTKKKGNDLLTPGCVECSKRKSNRSKWKRTIKEHVEQRLADHIEHARLMLAECEELLRRHRAGLDIVRWDGDSPE